MFFFHKNDKHEIIAIDDKSGWNDERYASTINRNDLKSFEAAECLASDSNVSVAACGRRFVAADHGENTSPRYDVIELPKVGDPVSYAFNGDYYPCGVITRVSPGPKYRRIEATENGNVRVFWRTHSGVGAGWRFDQTWSLVKGHVSKLNPEF